MDLLEHEAIGDPSEAAGGDTGFDTPVDATADTPVVDAPVDVVAEPAPQYLTAEQAAEIADARFEARLQQYIEQAGQQAPQEQGEQIDLDPYSDNFGQNLLTLLGQRDDYIMNQMRELFQPVQSRFEREDQVKGGEMINAYANEHGLGEAAQKVFEPLLKLQFTEAQRTYGEKNPRAADAALQKTVSLLKAIDEEAFKRGQSANETGLHAVANANREPGTGGGAISVAPAGGDELSVVRRHTTLQVA